MIHYNMSYYIIQYCIIMYVYQCTYNDDNDNDNDNDTNISY